MINPEETYQAKRDSLQATFRATAKNHEAVALGKDSSNLFRPRHQGQVQRLDVKSLNGVIDVDPNKLIAEVEGMATYETVVDATLQKGCMPLVVPQLKTITVGGGVSGLAIESSSFRHGLTHESVREMDVLTGAGEIVRATPTNEYQDLFHGLPNSYGTLGYILKLTIGLQRVKPFVHLRHLRFDNAPAFFKALQQICEQKVYEGKPVDFVDGVVFEPNEMYITVARGVDEAPYVSDYTFEHMFYRSIAEKQEDYLTIRDYIWRWDTDWFWCSKNVGAQNPIVRRLLGRKRLGSRTYSRMMNFENRWHVVERLQRLVGQYRPQETIIQDVQVPIGKAAEFLDFFQANIGIKPVWVCPTRAASTTWPWVLYPMDPGTLYVNVGFWDAVPAVPDKPEGYLNRLIEKKVSELHGTKGLYSSSYYTRPEFEALYNYVTYRPLKTKYDPAGRFKDLYDKCVKNG